MARINSITNRRKLGLIAGDDKQAFVIRRDISGGQNNRVHGTVLPENQIINLHNSDIGVSGQSSKAPGMTLVEDLSNNAIQELFGFHPTDANDVLVAIEGTNLKTWPGSGTFTTRKSDLTTGLATKLIKAYETGEGDVLLISNGTDNVFRMNVSFSFQDLGDTNTSPPKTKVMTNSRAGRVWVLKDDLLYFSSAAPSDYSTAFDRTTNAFRIPCGEEQVLLDTRDLGLIVGGTDSIWSLNASITPDPTTDKPEKLVDDGVAAGRTFVQGYDDYYYLAFDGIRGLKRTIQDKLQLGQSFPVSYALKDDFDTINWASIDKACAIFWDNKYFISLPTSGSSTNNEVWVYWPALNGWAVLPDWNVSTFAKFQVNGQELLYAGDATDGKVYRAWSGTTINGTSTTYSETGREEDLSHPLVRKVAGELKIVAEPAGAYTLTVYGSFDGSDFNQLGTMDLSGLAITFPVTFPVGFSEGARSYKKFHLDRYGPWYTFKYKLETSGDSTDIKIYERQLIANLEDKISEESQ